MIRERSDCTFLMITKRIDRVAACLPADWGEGWPHVVLCCTCETQERADYRLPIYLSLPLCRREVICEPLLERLDLSRYLAEPSCAPAKHPAPTAHPDGRHSSDGIPRSLCGTRATDSSRL